MAVNSNWGTGVYPLAGGNDVHVYSLVYPLTSGYW